MTSRSGIPDVDVRAQLARILGHRDFEGSKRTRELLQYLVEESLAGHDSRLKGYTIAVEVFGRPPDFDANLDPIVRIQAGRLRRALEHYYLVAGGADPIAIGVPRGGYVPEFTRREAATPTAPAGESPFDRVHRIPPGVSLSVLPLREIAGEPEGGFFADGLGEELCNELARYQDLAVIPCRRDRLPADGGPDHRELSRLLGARFLLEGSVRRSGDRVKISARLIDGPEERQVWAQGYERSLSPSSLIGIQEQIARSVAAAVAGEYGIMARRVAAETRKSAPSSLSSYEALLRFHDYEISLDPEAGAQCLSALRATVEREPDYGPPWAALSELLANMWILDLPGAEHPRGAAAECARRGAALAPHSQLARGAMANIHYLLGEREAFLRELEITLELNPGSPYYLGAVGYTLILAGECERGRALLERAIAANPCYPAWFDHGLFVYHYQKGDYARAHQETLKASFGIHFWGPLLRAAVLGRLGRTAEAEEEASRLLALVPDFESRARDLTSRPILSAAIVDALLDGLREAGLSVEPEGVGVGREVPRSAAGGARAWALR